MSDITPGSYVWYTRKNAIVKVLEFDRQSNSYTILYKGRVIDTIDKFLDTNIGLYCMSIFEENIDLKRRVSYLESVILELRGKK
jgi:hypothetical protein